MKSAFTRTVAILVIALAAGAVLSDDSVAQKKRTTTRQKQAVPKQPVAVVDTTTVMTQPQPQPVIENDTLHLGDTLRVTRQRIERLQAVLDKVTFGPQSYYFSRFRSWVIPLSDALNDSIAQHFFEVSDNDSSFIEARGDIQVIATPEPSRDLVALYFTGNSKERKGQRLREALLKKPERQLYRQVLESREYSEDKELIDRKFKIVDQRAPQLVKDADSIIVPFERYSLNVNHKNATVAVITLPEGFRIRFGDMWGLETKLGYDEFSLPGWTAGNIDFLAIYNQMKIGFHVPFKWGIEETSKDLVGIWQQRWLVGTYGVTASFDWAYAGGSLLVGFPRNDEKGTFFLKKNYNVRVAAQTWYSFTVSINENASLLRVKTGLGFQMISRYSYPPTPVLIDQFSFWTPYFKAEYTNQQFARRFGASVQYFRAYGLGNLWFEILRDQLRIEFKYASPIFRSAEEWEPPFFWTLSIPFTFSL